ncbi:MAG: serine hydrolase [bacterium]|nr:serine hydrolase [bacterium]
MTTKHRSRIGSLMLAAACLCLLAAQTQPVVAGPAEADWPRWETPEEAGFSSEQVAEAEQLWGDLDNASLASSFLVYKERVLAAFGDSSKEYLCPTVRGTLLVALYGTQVENGNIDVERTLEEVGITDLPALTRAERQAKISHLLQARSGVYHEAACESQWMKDNRPARGSHPPGTFWYLNNWDVNALGTIYFQETGREIFEEFEEKIARPLGMQDFQASDCNYRWEMRYSLHSCYWFRMSVRDRARLGQLFLQNGKWGNGQIIPETWVEESTRAYSVPSTPRIPGIGFGYMWWTLEPEFFESILMDSRLHHLRGFAATDFGGQAIVVLPDAEMVVVVGSEVSSDIGFDMVETFPMMEKILTAREIIDLAALRPKARPRVVLPGETLRLTAKTKNHGERASAATKVDFYLSAKPTGAGELRWIGSADLAPLADGKKKSTRSRAAVPEDLPLGEYYLITAVDRDKDNYDLARDNNVSISKRTIEVRGLGSPLGPPLAAQSP